MAKQMYDNKRYSPIAWRPLQQWLNHTDPTEKLQRLAKIKSFTRHDNDLISVFAEGLWTLANLPNLPWGRGLTTQTYSQIPKSEKVVGYLRVSLCFFFLIFGGFLGAYENFSEILGATRTQNKIWGTTKMAYKFGGSRVISENLGGHEKCYPCSSDVFQPIGTRE